MNEHTSARAVQDLNAHGVKNTAALLGGWNSWKEAGLPTDVTPVPAVKK
jgi:3-mercaptopyruvate sulfurtransferase SseA